MDSYVPDIESTQVKVALAFRSYRTDTFRLVESDLAGGTHIVASRQGLYVANESEVRLIAHGFFFGITMRDDAIFVFETCDLPRGPTRQGRLVKLTVQNERITDARVILKGLDNGCHQIDFIGDTLYILDTYNQLIVSVCLEDGTMQSFRPESLPMVHGRGGAQPDYVHINSLLAVGDKVHVLLHNGAQHTGRNSEIAVFDRGWHELERLPLEGSGCHGLALLEDGTLLTCGSMEGRIISPHGFALRVSPHLTRGLAVGEDSIAVGASQLVMREDRLRNSGTITFMDRKYKVQSVLNVPGAPTEIRRLDGQDAGLSNYLRQIGRTTSVKGAGLA